MSRKKAYFPHDCAILFENPNNKDSKGNDTLRSPHDNRYSIIASALI